MESSKDFPKFAVRQLFGCSGYEISLLNSEEWNNNFQLVHMPLVATSNKIPDDVEVFRLRAVCARTRIFTTCARRAPAQTGKIRRSEGRSYPCTAGTWSSRMGLQDEVTGGSNTLRAHAVSWTEGLVSHLYGEDNLVLAAWLRAIRTIILQPY